jgi:hypothetical protein
VPPEINEMIDVELLFCSSTPDDGVAITKLYHLNGLLQIEFHFTRVVNVIH